MQPVNKKGDGRGMNPNSRKNLTPDKRISKETASKLQELSVQAHYEKKAISNVAYDVLNKPLKKFGVTFQEYTLVEIANIIVKKLETGEVNIDDVLRFFQFLRDTSGQKPTDKQEITNPTPQIVVASQADADILKRIADVDPYKDIPQER